MKKILIIVLAILFLKTAARDFCLAQTSASQIQREQEILEKEKALREKIEKEEKIFIKKIIVEGVTSLTQDQIKEIISPFEKRWLTKENIQQIMDLILQAYRQKEPTRAAAKISYQIKKRCLKISVEE